jgi:putrescine transport system permease protein
MGFNGDRSLNGGRRFLTAGLMVWYGVFFLIPFLLVVKISLSQVADTIPPYTPLVSFDGVALTLSVTAANFIQLFGDPLFVHAYVGSLKIAAITTALCVLIGYPIAYAVAAAPAHRRSTLLLLITIPFWTSFLIRIYAWIGICRISCDWTPLIS